jgi:capsular polysaccharide transport system permease protein
MPPNRAKSPSNGKMPYVGSPRQGLRRIYAASEIQQRCLKALFIRDLMTRYGREHLGFAWVVLEPMLLTVGVLVLWSVLKGGYERGIRIVELVLTGYMLLTLWRHLTSSPILLFRRNVPLLYHRTVSVFDIFYSRILLEFAGTTTALLFVMGTLLLLGVVSPVADWSLLISGWLLMAILATGVGSLILVATEINETAEKFIQPVQYLLVPISGTFFMVGWLPPAVQDVILFNPIVHCYEMLRSGFFGPGVETFYSVAYVLSWAFILNFLGLWGMNRARKNLQIA